MNTIRPVEKEQLTGFGGWLSLFIGRLIFSLVVNAALSLPVILSDLRTAPSFIFPINALLIGYSVLALLSYVFLGLTLVFD